MSDDVVRFPVKSWQRVANRRGRLSASCIITDRWLRFEEGATKREHGTAVFVDVLTDTSGESRKIARLCITLEELRRGAITDLPGRRGSWRAQLFAKLANELAAMLDKKHKAETYRPSGSVTEKPRNVRGAKLVAV